MSYYYQRNRRNKRARVSPYPYVDVSKTPVPPIPPLIKETRDAGTQTISRDKNLDPINYARIYISTQIQGENIEEKRRKFFDDSTLNNNIRKVYGEFLQEHNHCDDVRKLTKINRKYHMLSHSLDTNILDMTLDEIKHEYPGIGWDYLGLQARMEYQRRNCTDLDEIQTDEKFFKEKYIPGNLKIGYSRWKSQNAVSNTTTLHIKSNQLKSAQTNTDDLIPVSEMLLDKTLNTNITQMGLNLIDLTYGTADRGILGLQARMEYAKNYDKMENPHNIDIDFMLAENVPSVLRVGYREWLSKHQLVQYQDELFVIKLSAVVEESNTSK